MKRVVVDPFDAIVDANKWMDKARRIEQEVHPGRVRIPKKIFMERSIILFHGHGIRGVDNEEKRVSAGDAI